MSDKLGRLTILSLGKYDNIDIGTLKTFADGRYRGWHCAAGFNIGGNLFQHFNWQKARLAL